MRMRRAMSPERRRVVAMAGAVCAMSGGVLLVQRSHPVVAGLLLGVMAGVLMVAISQFVRLKRSVE